ncbi:hypothetical protein K491DRAFT_698474 [Lophiostoma macrostomum CBS 122681]|uniref:RING-type domain-containing protein n=1 Tax=Lophiostoma macrostomum CBS 122681 TaxID=1314788 RepID=A0A6A6SQV7_9PLEO|nr:hypothetical protein K491DRAFT_698474 [Lophiostoma macrostomum CBS 122681]
METQIEGRSMLRSITVDENGDYPCFESDLFVLASRPLEPQMPLGNPRCHTYDEINSGIVGRIPEQCPHSATIGSGPLPVCERHQDSTVRYQRSATVWRGVGVPSDGQQRIMRRLPALVNMLLPNVSTGLDLMGIDSFTTVVEHHPAVDCGICRETSNKMRRLQHCGHEFDEECLLSWMNSGQMMSFTCPACRAHLPLSRPGLRNNDELLDYLTDSR